VVADSYQFVEEQDLVTDLNSSEKIKPDPDPHFSEKLDSFFRVRNIEYRWRNRRTRLGRGGMTLYSSLPDMKEPMRVKMAQRNTPPAMMAFREYRSPKILAIGGYCFKSML
jgi:hypothetical protein